MSPDAYDTSLDHCMQKSCLAGDVCNCPCAPCRELQALLREKQEKRKEKKAAPRPGVPLKKQTTFRVEVKMPGRPVFFGELTYPIPANTPATKQIPVRIEDPAAPGGVSVLAVMRSCISPVKTPSDPTPKEPVMPKTKKTAAVTPKQTKTVQKTAAKKVAPPLNPYAKKAQEKRSAEDLNTLTNYAKLLERSNLLPNGFLWSTIVDALASKGAELGKAGLREKLQFLEDAESDGLIAPGTLVKAFQTALLGLPPQSTKESPKPLVAGNTAGLRRELNTTLHATEDGDSDEE